LRNELPGDVPAIHELVVAAFGQEDEAKLVDGLREQGDLVLSHVADRKGEIIAHLAFSPLQILDAEGSPLELPGPVLGLAPMAVAPKFQRTGVGTGLLRSAMARLSQEGVAALVVLGHPNYYPRFGFKPASQARLRCPFEVPDAAFLLWTPEPLGDDALAGTVKYAPAFGI